MTSCSRCLIPPAPIPETGTLCIAPQLEQTVATVREFLRLAQLAYAEPVANLLTIPLSPGVMQQLADGLGGLMSHAELRDTRSLVTGVGALPSLQDLVSMQPLGTLFAQVQGEWFTSMLRESRLVSHFQPIVHAGNPGEVFAYECLLRGEETDGTLVSPGRLFHAAREADLLFQLDRAARLTSIRSAALHGLDVAPGRLFINFNPTSIYNPAFCLKSTVAAIEETCLSPDRIVFEVVESDQVTDVAHLVRVMEFYRNSGFKVALDDLGSGYGSLNLLSKLKPDFVKLDMQLVRDVDQNPYKSGIVAKLLEMARDLGVMTVAEGIETEGEWSWIREHGAEYAQGYFFAHPAGRPPRPRQWTEAVDARHRWIPSRNGAGSALPLQNP